MPDDVLLVTLIEEATNGSSRSRRVAANLLLDLLIHDPTNEVFKGQQESVEAKETPEVVMEFRALIEQYGLGG